MNDQLTYFMPSAQRLISFKEPLIMSIVNLTEDSFYEKSRFSGDEIVDVCGRMLEEGADILDIGAMSTRPGAIELSVETEIDRLLPVIQLLRREFPQAIISIDTYRSAVVRSCASYGIDIVNDITAGTRDKEMFSTVGDLGLPYIIMHMKGMPVSMQRDTNYEDLILEIMGFFSQRVYTAREAGIKDIMLDPGIGFGKSLEDNYKILRRLPSFKIFDLPILIGLSRKSFIYKTLDTSAEEALNGTTAMHMIALLNGASILRVHDVKEAIQCRKLYNVYCGVRC
jgi:dihydropteroate synthase